MVLWGKLLRSAFVVLLTLVVLLRAVKAYRDAPYFDNYDPRAPLNVAVIETTEVNNETPEKGYRSPNSASTDIRARRYPH